MQPDPESILQQASPLPRCPMIPVTPGLRLPDSFGDKLFELLSLAFRSASVGAYGGGASITRGGDDDGGRASFMMYSRILEI